MSNPTLSGLVAAFGLITALATAPLAAAAPAARPASAPQGTVAASAPTTSTAKIGTKKPILPGDKIAPGAVQKATTK